MGICEYNFTSYNFKDTSRFSTAHIAFHPSGNDFLFIQQFKFRFLFMFLCMFLFSELIVGELIVSYLPLSLSLYIYIYTSISLFLYIYIYIYTYYTGIIYMSLSLSPYIYIYIYIYVQIPREVLKSFRDYLFDHPLYNDFAVFWSELYNDFADK